ncbi:MAG: CoA pyrophosphatase [Firmicutes bacterium]|nr:CoA pyrophosphatase [Bacillota bacterium]
MEYSFEKLKGRAPGIILQEGCRRSAVIIPLIKEVDGIKVLFQVRSEAIDRQPGDICFPGGAIQDGEEPLETALREASEELLISPDQLDVICACDVFHNASGIVYPFAAWLSGYDGRFSEDEVAEVFSVPLDYFMQTDPVVCTSEMVRKPDQDFPYELIHGGRDYKWPRRVDKELFYLWEGRAVWGITARILKGFLDILR